MSVNLIASLYEHISALLRGQTDHADYTLDIPDRIVDLASEHGVAALLYARLDEIVQPDAYINSLRDALKPNAFQQAACEVIIAREIKQVIVLLSANDVKFLLLKGTPLAYTLYPQAYLRSRLDTDILIAQADRSRIKTLLKELGFEPELGIDGTLATHQFMLSKKVEQGFTFTLDIHWKITNPQAFANLLEFEELFPDRQVVQALGANAYAPSPLHMLTHALIHRVAHHHGRDRLIWLYDIYLLVNQLDKSTRQQFVTQCTLKKINTICLDGIQAAHKAFGGENLQKLIQMITVNACSPQEKDTAAFLKPGFNGVDQFRSDWNRLNWLQRLQLLGEHCFPSADYMHRRYGNAPLLFLYINRFNNGLKKLFGIG